MKPVRRCAFKHASRRTEASYLRRILGFIRLCGKRYLREVGAVEPPAYPFHLTTAGIASFLWLCMLPVIPAFFAQLAGTSLRLLGAPASAALGYADEQFSCSSVYPIIPC